MAEITTMNSSEAERRFLSWEAMSRDTIDVKRCYLDLTGDLVAGILLSQIIYWFLPTRSGESRLRVVRQGRHWLAKRREDWWDECRLSAKQYDRAIGILCDELGVVQTKVFRWNGAPTTHITVCWDVLESRLAIPKDAELAVSKKAVIAGEMPILPKGEYRGAPMLDFSGNPPPILPKGEVPFRPAGVIPLITETTTETKSKYSPQPPKGGARSNHRSGEALDPAIEAAVDAVMGGCSFAGTRGLRTAVRETLAAYAAEKRNDPMDVAAMMIEAYRVFLEVYEILSFPPGPKNFFREGHWRNTKGWRIDRKAADARSEARVGRS